MPAFKAFPRDVAIEMKYEGGNLKFQMQTGMDNEADATGFVDSANDLIKKGLDELKNPPPFPPNIPNPDKLIKGATEMLKSIKVEAKGKAVNGSMTINQDLINGYFNMGLALIGQLGFQQPPAPRPVAMLYPVRPGVVPIWVTS
jgi:hypothetical protein